MKERRKIQNEYEEIFRVLFHLFGNFVIIFTDRANNTYRSIHRMQMQNEEKKYNDNEKTLRILFASESVGYSINGLTLSQ